MEIKKAWKLDKVIPENCIMQNRTDAIYKETVLVPQFDKEKIRKKD
jgi:hypothetical protein